MRTVYVVMCNDYPDKVFLDEDTARDYAGEMNRPGDGIYYHVEEAQGMW